jgi:hypothetical protein
MNERKYIRVSSGAKYYPLAPASADVDIEVIAHHLSNLCRFTGATRELYSVAQHSYYVSYLCARKDAPFGIVHDSPEAFVNDLSRPVKHSESLAGYRAIEDLNMDVICEAFHLDLEQPQSVSLADKWIVEVERYDLIPHEPGKRSVPFDVFPEITPWSPRIARHLFLDRFNELFEKRDGLWHPRPIEAITQADIEPYFKAS